MNHFGWFFVGFASGIAFITMGIFILIGYVARQEHVSLRTANDFKKEIEKALHRFPDSPSMGDTHVYDEVKYIWTGEKWVPFEI
jgi:hypothetical protein